jgi:hypothetical protein
VKLFLSIILSLYFLTAYASPHKATYWGEKVQIGNGNAQSYIKIYHGNPKEIGVIIEENALINLPEHEMQEFIIPMPEDIDVKPYKHIILDWNPHGHEPDGIYDKPHFDIHFYFISQNERATITCLNEDLPICMQTPLSEFQVSDYAPTPAGVPAMGWHWVDLLSPEFNGGIFTRTFIYGYYAGIPIFIEPMVTLEFLKSKIESELKIRRPTIFPYAGGYFPEEYKIKYDRKHKFHKIILKEFKKQE